MPQNKGNNMKTLIELVKGSHHVHRWAGQTVNGHRRSISEHHAEVYVWTKEILESCSSVWNYFNSLSPSITIELFNHAMFHDIPEVFTGDIPYTTKLMFPEIKETLNEVEKKIEQEYNLGMDRIDSSCREVIKLVVKTADMLVVYNEFVDYQDSNGISVMANMSKNVFDKFKACKDIPRAILYDIEDFYKNHSIRMSKELERHQV